MSLFARPTTLNALRMLRVVGGLDCGLGKPSQKMFRFNLHAGAPPGAARG